MRVVEIWKLWNLFDFSENSIQASAEHEQVQSGFLQARGKQPQKRSFCNPIFDLLF